MKIAVTLNDRVRVIAGQEGSGLWTPECPLGFLKIR